MSESTHQKPALPSEHVLGLIAESRKCADSARIGGSVHDASAAVYWLSDAVKHLAPLLDAQALVAPIASPPAECKCLRFVACDSCGPALSQHDFNARYPHGRSGEDRGPVEMDGVEMLKEVLLRGIDSDAQLRAIIDAVETERARKEDYVRRAVSRERNLRDALTAEQRARSDEFDGYAKVIGDREDTISDLRAKLETEKSRPSWHVALAEALGIREPLWVTTETTELIKLTADLRGDRLLYRDKLASERQRREEAERDAETRLRDLQLLNGAIREATQTNLVNPREVKQHITNLRTDVTQAVSERDDCARELERVTAQLEKERGWLAEGVAGIRVGVSAALSEPTREAYLAENATLRAKCEELEAKDNDWSRSYATLSDEYADLHREKLAAEREAAALQSRVDKAVGMLGNMLAHAKAWPDQMGSCIKEVREVLLTSTPPAEPKRDAGEQTAERECIGLIELDLNQMLRVCKEDTTPWDGEHVKNHAFGMLQHIHDLRTGKLTNGGGE